MFHAKPVTIALSLLGLVGVEGYGLHERMSERRAIEALGPKLDKLDDIVRHIDALRAPAEKQHAVCPAKLSHLDHDIDLGVPEPCPNPDDGMCVRGMPLSAAQARCEAGKL